MHWNQLFIAEVLKIVVHGLENDGIGGMEDAGSPAAALQGGGTRKGLSNKCVLSVLSIYNINEFSCN